MTKKAKPAHSATNEDSHAGARVPKQAPKRGGTGGVVEGRIAHIETMMHGLKFQTGKTNKQLAAEWGLSLNTVEQYSAEASRRVRASVLNKDHVSATVGQALETAIHSAVVAGEWRVVAQLADTWAKISGASAASRTEISGASGGPIVHYDLRGITDEQLERLVTGDASGLAATGGGREKP